MTVAEGLVQFIKDKKNQHVFGVSGANIEELFFSFSQSTVKPVLAKTEYQAVLMALGSYLASQQIHVALTTSGAGVLNTLPVLAEAYASRQPLVLIAGLPPTQLEGHGAFQDTSSLSGSLDLQALLKPITSYQQKITSGEEIHEALEKAWANASKEKRPAVILVNRNVFSQQWITKPITEIDHNTLSAANITDLKNKLNEFNERPLFILGEELIHLRDKSFILKLAEKYHAIIACTPQAKGFFNHLDARFTGLIGMMGTTKSQQALAETTHVLLIGSRMDHLSRFGVEELLKTKNIFHVSAFSDKAFISAQISVVGDLDDILRGLL